MEEKPPLRIYFCKHYMLLPDHMETAQGLKQVDGSHYMDPVEEEEKKKKQAEEKKKKREEEEKKRRGPVRAARMDWFSSGLAASDSDEDEGCSDSDSHGSEEPPLKRPKPVSDSRHESIAKARQRLFDSVTRCEVAYVRGHTEPILNNDRRIMLQRLEKIQRHERFLQLDVLPSRSKVAAAIYNEALVRNFWREVDPEDLAERRKSFMAQKECVICMDDFKEISGTTNVALMCCGQIVCAECYNTSREVNTGNFYLDSERNRCPVCRSLRDDHYVMTFDVSAPDPQETKKNVSRTFQSRISSIVNTTKKIQARTKGASRTIFIHGGFYHSLAFMAQDLTPESGVACINGFTMSNLVTGPSSLKKDKRYLVVDCDALGRDTGLLLHKYDTCSVVLLTPNACQQFLDCLKAYLPLMTTPQNANLFVFVPDLGREALHKLYAKFDECIKSAEMFCKVEFINRAL